MGSLPQPHPAGGLAELEGSGGCPVAPRLSGLPRPLRVLVGLPHSMVFSEKPYFIHGGG